MNKGIVMEVRERDCIVLTDSGAFVRVPRRGGTFEVGAEITLPPARRSLPRRTVWTGGSAAAALLLVAFLFSMIGGPPGSFSSFSPFGPASKPADLSVAYVTIDVNPSIEFGIDSSETVVEVRELNADAEVLADGLVLQGKPLETAVRLYMERAESELLKDRDEADIVITSVMVDESASLVEEKLTTALAKEVQEVLVEHHDEELESFRVTVWSAPSELKQEADEVGLSTGKMAFYLKAQADGAEVTLTELKEQSIHTIAKRYEEKQLLESSDKFTKDEMKRLLQEAKASLKAAKEALEDENKRGDDGDDDDDGVKAGKDQAKDKDNGDNDDKNRNGKHKDKDNEDDDGNDAKDNNDGNDDKERDEKDKGDKEKGDRVKGDTDKGNKEKGDKKKGDKETGNGKGNNGSQDNSNVKNSRDQDADKDDGRDKDGRDNENRKNNGRNQKDDDENAPARENKDDRDENEDKNRDQDQLAGQGRGLGAEKSKENGKNKD